MHAFNFLPREEAQQTVMRGRPGPAQLALAVAALLLIAALAAMFLVMNARLADKERERDDLRAELAREEVPAEEPVQPGTDPALVEERNKRTAALANALGSRVAWDRLLRELSLVLPDDVWLTTLTANAPGASGTATATGTTSTPPPTATGTGFQVVGYSYDQEGVAELLSRLAVLPELASVQLVSSARTKIGETDVVEFTISATVKPGPGGPTA
jgi:Tfp pilus assembly protein PilN